jgi:hypothetical protein
MWKNPLQPRAGRVSKKRINGKSGFSAFFFHDHAALVIELALIPVGAVEHVGLSCRGTGRYVWRFGLVVCPTLA